MPDRDGPCRPVVWPCRTVPGRPGPQPLTFIDRAWAGPAPNPSLLSKGPGPARPPSPHFYRQGPGQPGPQALTFIDRAQAGPAPNPSLLLANPSLLLARPLTSIGQAPHFYWPDPSLLLARPLTLLARPLTSISQARPRQAGPCRGHVGTVPDRVVQILAVSPCQPDTGTSLISIRMGLSLLPYVALGESMRAGLSDDESISEFYWVTSSLGCQ